MVTAPWLMGRAGQGWGGGARGGGGAGLVGGIDNVALHLVAVADASLLGEVDPTRRPTTTALTVT